MTSNQKILLAAFLVGIILAASVFAAPAAFAIFGAIGVYATAAAIFGIGFFGTGLLGLVGRTLLNVFQKKPSTDQDEVPPSQPVLDPIKLDVKPSSVQDPVRSFSSPLSNPVPAPKRGICWKQATSQPQQQVIYCNLAPCFIIQMPRAFNHALVAPGKKPI